MDTLRIGQLARASGVGVETIRFYERAGLIEEPPRRASGYRAYPRGAIARIRFIRHAKDLGFSLREISELLALRVRKTSSCARVKAQAKAKLDDVESRIESLRRMRQTLAKLVKMCEVRRASDECPILEALESHE